MNAVRGGAKDRSASPDNAQFLSKVQQKLKEQTESLAQRAMDAEHPGLLRFTVGLGQTTTLVMAGQLEKAGAEVMPVTAASTRARAWRRGLAAGFGGAALPSNCPARRA